MTEVKQNPTQPEPICCACIGDGFNSDGGVCPRCGGGGVDPDPAAPTGIVPVAP